MKRLIFKQWEELQCFVRVGQKIEGAKVVKNATRRPIELNNQGLCRLTETEPPSKEYA